MSGLLNRFIVAHWKPDRRLSNKFWYYLIQQPKCPLVGRAAASSWQSPSRRAPIFPTHNYSRQLQVTTGGKQISVSNPFFSPWTDRPQEQMPLSQYKEQNSLSHKLILGSAHMLENLHLVWSPSRFRTSLLKAEMTDTHFPCVWHTALKRCEIKVNKIHRVQDLHL